MEVPAPRIRILMADNVEVMLETLAVILDLAGYEVCAVYGGEAAIRLLDLLQPEMVLMDVTARGVAQEVSRTSALQVPRCKMFLFHGQTTLHNLLPTREAMTLPFELVTRPITATDLLAKLRTSLCSERPPLLVPIETAELPIH